MPLDIELRKTKRVVLALSKSGPNFCFEEILTSNEIFRPYHFNLQIGA
jgi:hypothetical protein